MGSSRSRRHFGTRVGLVLVGVALVVPSPAPAAGYAGGVIPEGFYQPCGKANLQSRIEFSFAGRIPSNGRFYQVLDGKGFGSWGCQPAPINLLTLTGASLAGSFEWACSGSITALVPRVNQLRQTLDFLDDTVGLPALFDRPTGGPTYLLDLTCSTVGHGDQFSYVAVLEAVEDQNPDYYTDKLLVRGAFVAAIN